MKSFIAILLVACAAATSTSETELRTKFGAYVSDFNKSYAAAEVEQRFSAFKASLVRIEEGNAERRARGVEETQGLTKFSDLTPR